MADIWQSLVQAGDIEFFCWQDEEQSVLLNAVSGTTHAIENSTLDILRACISLRQGTIHQIATHLGISSQDIDPELTATVEHHLLDLQNHELLKKVSK